MGIMAPQMRADAPPAHGPRCSTKACPFPARAVAYVDGEIHNNRKLDDGQRCDIAVRRIVGKRLTWDQLTGKVEAPGPVGATA